MEAWCGACPFVLLVDTLLTRLSFWQSTEFLVVSYIVVSRCAERSFASFAQARNDVTRLVVGFYIRGMNASGWVVKPNFAVDTMLEIRCLLWPLRFLLLFGIH